jgi:hypothetical protein
VSDAEVMAEERVSAVAGVIDLQRVTVLADPASECAREIGSAGGFSCLAGDRCAVWP